MSAEPESLILQMLREMRAEIGETRGEVRSLRADVASDLAIFQAKVGEENKQTREQIVGLRRAVIEYHTSVIGHGVLISELEARVRRLEQALNLPAPEAH